MSMADKITSFFTEEEMACFVSAVVIGMLDGQVSMPRVDEILANRGDEVWEKTRRLVDWAEQQIAGENLVSLTLKGMVFADMSGPEPKFKLTPDGIKVALDTVDEATDEDSGQSQDNDQNDQDVSCSGADPFTREAS